MTRKKKQKLPVVIAAIPDYDRVIVGVVQLLEEARRASARAVNAFITTTYWKIGRRIVEFEQSGSDRASYGEGLLKRLAADLTQRFGRGFSLTNIKQFRKFYLVYRAIKKSQTPSDLFPLPELPAKGQVENEQAASVDSTILQTLSEESAIARTELSWRFPLPWSHYVLLLKVEKLEARAFYEAEALRNGWTVRQLERQITTLFYERTLASRNKGAMLEKGAVARPGEELSPAEEIKDPFAHEVQ